MRHNPKGRIGAWRFGHRAETAAAWWLRLTGYSIVARRYRTYVGEIDIVARRGRVVVFVEVKGRASLDAAAGAISRRQQQRIAAAAAVFLQSRPDLGDLDIRFDAVLVQPWHRPRHLKDAWRVEP